MPVLSDLLTVFLTHLYLSSAVPHNVRNIEWWLR